MTMDPLLWRRKAYPAPPGPHYHGKPEWFRDGLPTSELNQQPAPDFCGVPFISPKSGGVMGGYATMWPETHPVNFNLDKTTVPLDSATLNNFPLEVGACFRLIPIATTALTGLQNGDNGRMIILENVGDHPLYCLHNNPASDPGNRFICLDGFSTRISPNYAGWFQYDGSSEKWREINTVPLVREKGDLLKHTLTTAVRLPAPEDPGLLLTTDPEEETGLKWAPNAAASQGGPDLNFYRQFGSERYGGEHWYVTTYGDLSNTGPSPPPENKLVAVPWISPQAGTLEKIGMYCSTAGSNSHKTLCGIYDSISTKDLYPKTLLASSAEFSGDQGGEQSTTIDLDVDGRKLYWLVFFGGVSFGAPQYNSWTTPPHVGWPIFGYQMGLTFGGAPQPIAVLLPSTYSGVLPSVFPDGGLLDEFIVAPHIGVTYAEP